jgi:hypothetical protein
MTNDTTTAAILLLEGVVLDIHIHTHFQEARKRILKTIDLLSGGNDALIPSWLLAEVQGLR